MILISIIVILIAVHFYDEYGENKAQKAYSDSEVAKNLALMKAEIIKALKKDIDSSYNQLQKNIDSVFIENNERIKVIEKTKIIYREAESNINASAKDDNQDSIQRIISNFSLN